MIDKNPIVKPKPVKTILSDKIINGVRVRRLIDPDHEFMVVDVFGYGIS